MGGTPWWKGHWVLFSSTLPTRGMKMFEILMALTVFGLLYVEIIEILEKCKHLHAVAEREARRHYASGFLTRDS